MANINTIKRELKSLASPTRAKNLQRFFKTGKGEYGYGDIFIGVTVPNIRNVAKANVGIDVIVIDGLMQSKIHEERLLALLILVQRYQRGNTNERGEIARLYINNRKYINNWDLVDLSADRILGQHLLNRSRAILYKFATSKNIWDRRIAIMSSFCFIKNAEFIDTLKLAEVLISDEHDLIQKAVGWMLREIGKRSMITEERFLIRFYKNMPRTMLRYAIEKFPERKRLAYLHGEAR